MYPDKSLKSVPGKQVGIYNVEGRLGIMTHEVTSAWRGKAVEARLKWETFRPIIK